MSAATDDFWEDLLDLIVAGNVLPVIGKGVTTCGDEDELLSPKLAARLADRLDLSESDLKPGFDLDDVFVRHLMNGDHETLLIRDCSVCFDESFVPGPTLQRLASVRGFRLFISTTVDSVLVDALNNERFEGKEATRVIQYSPSEPNDIPDRLQNLRGANVFQILGRAAPQVDAFVGWDEDLLEFICSLSGHLVPDVMPHLARDLADRNVRILAIGLNFSHWLLRFFLRVARQKRLSSHEQGMTWPAEAEPGSHPDPDNVVMFFGDIAKRVKLLDTEPREFVRELSNRWSAKHPQEDPGPLPGSRLNVFEEMPP